jgi:cytochrome P450
VRRLEGWIRGHAHDLVSEMAHLGEGDFVQLVSVKLPGRIFGSFFGLPEGELRDKAVTAAQPVMNQVDMRMAPSRRDSMRGLRRGNSSLRSRNVGLHNRLSSVLSN